MLRAELGDPELNVPPVPRKPNMPRLTAALLYAVPGGASGATGKALVRAKEVERRLNIARAAYYKGQRAAKADEQVSADWGVAQAALATLKANQFKLDSLTKDKLLALVRVLKAGKAMQEKQARFSRARDRVSRSCSVRRARSRASRSGGYIGTSSTRPLMPRRE